MSGDEKIASTGKSNVAKSTTAKAKAKAASSPKKTSAISGTVKEVEAKPKAPAEKKKSATAAKGDEGEESNQNYSIETKSGREGIKSG